MNAYDIAKPLLFSLPAETAHGLGHGVVSAAGNAPLDRALARHYAVDDPRLRVDALEETFPNPVGVAAGFDKNAEAVRGLAALGFGFVEVGGVTAVPQSGNQRPRMFRLRDDDAVINRMGLNNDGAEAVGERLAALDAPVPVGVNIAKSEHVDTAGAPADYLATYEEVAAGGDFFVVNVSCPNSQGFEELQNREAMTAILTELQDAGAAPLLIKLSPDLPEPAVADTLDLVTELGLDGVVATNTSTERPDGLESPNRVETGGLSGAPIEARATEMTRFVAERVDVPVIGVGGVATAEDAYRKIRAGASLVQLYTAFLYRGPAIAREINLGLLELLERDGFDSVEAAVGADLD
ncbi:quinone-dependent dihydroorotate dehydrogenase [Halosimplex pelagicum]|uniref:Dihydroorotate dehydrogenase (quinone) n=1 Tax=Halosimplex pelagicum TaxID=869886 RepID=A0A7D5TSX7_9EURY|nr:quinone-dependent dihydroorotate dehydrogenase [Halosimplex pelagicum]QLH80954.1 quinone-dependent dihydroorotate dehydrogenase [Halosimplex pelagicum]